MTKDEAIYTLKNTAFLGWSEQAEKVSEAVRMAVEALKRETSGDAISRHDAIDALMEILDRPNHAEFLYTDEICKALNELPSVQPVDKDINVSCKDAISRQGAIDICNIVIDLWQGQLGEGALVAIKNAINNLPSVQPQRTCVNCGRTANNGGWYADGRTRCPIEEHYALPKDGYCHLWEKRNVTDDDYPERREE